MSIDINVNSLGLSYYGPSGESLANIFNETIFVEHPMVLPIILNSIHTGNKTYILLVNPCGYAGRVDIKLIDPQFQPNPIPVEGLISKIIHEAERYCQPGVKYDFDYQDGWIRDEGEMVKIYLDILSSESRYPASMNNIMSLTVMSLLVSGLSVGGLYELAWNNLSDPELFRVFLTTPVDRLYAEIRSRETEQSKKLSEYDIL
jgi:hypothetical protein